VHRKDGDRYRPLARLTTGGDKITYTGATAWAGDLMVSTFNKGLIWVNAANGDYTFINQPLVLPSPAVAQSAVDHNGRLWVATTRGIAVLESPHSGRILPTKELPLSAYRTDGLLVTFEDRAEFLKPKIAPERRPRAYSYVPTTSGPALGYWGNVTVGGKEIEVPGSAVEHIAELPDRTLIAMSGERLYHVDFGSGGAKELQEPHVEVSGLAVVGDFVWAATTTGEIHRSSATPPVAFSRIIALPKPGASTLHRFGDTLIVANNDGVRFGEKLGAVVHTDGLRSPRLATTADGTVWLIGEQDGHLRLGRLRREGETVVWETVEAKGLARVPGVQHLSRPAAPLRFAPAPTSSNSRSRS